MYIVERRNAFHVAAENPEAAALSALEFEATTPLKGAVLFDVWNTTTGEFFVVRFDPDFDPCDDDSQEFKVVDQLTLGARKRLVEEMIYLAHCDDKNLRTICEMAATSVKSSFDYVEWMKRAGDETDTETNQGTTGSSEEKRR